MKSLSGFKIHLPEVLKCNIIPISPWEQLIDMREDGNSQASFEQNLSIIGG